MGGRRVKCFPSPGFVLPVFNSSFYAPPYMHLPLCIKLSDLKVPKFLPLFLSNAQDPVLGIKDNQGPYVTPP